VKFTKEMWIQEMNSSPAFWMLLPAQMNVKMAASDKQHAIFAHQLQSAMRSTMGFPKVYVEL